MTAEKGMNWLFSFDKELSLLIRLKKKIAELQRKRWVQPSAVEEPSPSLNVAKSMRPAPPAPSLRPSVSRKINQAGRSIRTDVNISREVETYEGIGNVTAVAPEEDLHLFAMRKQVHSKPSPMDSRAKKTTRFKYSNLGKDMDGAVDGMTRELLESIKETELKRHIYETRVKAVKVAIDFENKRLTIGKKSLGRAIRSAQRSVGAMLTNWTAFVDKQVELKRRTKLQYRERGSGWSDEILLHRKTLGDNQEESYLARLNAKVNELENLRKAVWLVDLLNEVRLRRRSYLIQIEQAEKEESIDQSIPVSCIRLLIITKIYVIRGMSVSPDTFLWLLQRLVQDHEDYTNFTFNLCLKSMYRNLLETPFERYIQHLDRLGVIHPGDMVEEPSVEQSPSEEQSNPSEGDKSVGSDEDLTFSGDHKATSAISDLSAQRISSLVGTNTSLDV